MSHLGGESQEKYSQNQALEKNVVQDHTRSDGIRLSVSIVWMMLNASEDQQFMSTRNTGGVPTTRLTLESDCILTHAKEDT